MTATTARAAGVAAEVVGDPAPADLTLLHAVLAQCCSLYRQPPGGARA